MEEREEFTAEIMPEAFGKYDLSFKIIVVGDTGVGKSCLSLKGIKNTFNREMSHTVGFEFLTFVVKIDNNYVKIQVWDTCGQDVYKSLIASFYRQSSLAILVYSIDNKQSFLNLETWLKELRMNAAPETKLFLVGNKLDLENKYFYYI